MLYTCSHIHCTQHQLCAVTILNKNIKYKGAFLGKKWKKKYSHFEEHHWENIKERICYKKFTKTTPNLWSLYKLQCNFKELTVTIGNKA